jgi:phosphoglycerol transferase MdoB-like AlkP superfamily enzyme
LVVVQSESFFDARRLWPAIHPQCYRWFDQLNADALLHGELAVPAIGANTLRSEFAFLTGLTNSEQGIHRFNPYRRLARQQLTTLASRLKAEGYRTVCVHPYPVSFYQRDRVFPHLGFDEFIDRKGFSHHSDNHYVGDEEVAERVRQILQQATEPTFVFVITMENHGPLQLEKVSIEEPAQYLTALPPKSVQELTAYLRHVVNAGKMAQILCDTLQQSPRPGLLCWYGDHLPILPELYQAEQFDSHRTDYLIWASAQQQSGLQRQAVAQREVHDLANLLLTLLAQHK